ncbi:Golgi-associated plant pathogenesis-related protein 1-like [Topomyia yanbarensis]|uniref:Golgi-associated plant pathogenesis-related protein 1-like n=1 Tax=Topomyia yanbarensis TaxID=2498891 RepID=UPI00273CF224|nr:Golgi-associated plant pathogenesis-related protein 1-like [Topomyia yanbarensis]
MPHQFQQEVLNEHNRLRAQHSAPPLQLSQPLCRYAQEWAQTIAGQNKLQHRTERTYGENLYAMFGKTQISGTDPVRSWYSEKKDYIFGQPDPGSNFAKVGHFTQVVWKGTKQLGVGMATNGSNVYVVCNYDPAGNFKKQYAQNVTA